MGVPPEMTGEQFDKWLAEYNAMAEEVFMEQVSE